MIQFAGWIVIGIYKHRAVIGDRLLFGRGSNNGTADEGTLGWKQTMPARSFASVFCAEDFGY